MTPLRTRQSFGHRVPASRHRDRKHTHTSARARQPRAACVAKQRGGGAACTCTPPYARPGPPRSPPHTPQDTMYLLVTNRESTLLTGAPASGR
eukprot:5414932-Prymnesium_polylepis.1